MNTHWNDLQSELTSIARQFDKVELASASAWRTRWSCIALLSAVFCGVAALTCRQQSIAQAPVQPAPEIVCNSLKILAPDGRDRVTLGYDQISGFAKVHGPDGKLRAALWTDDKGKYGQLSLMDDMAKNRIMLSGYDNGGGCTFFAADGRKHTYIGTASNLNGGIVSLLGPQGQTVVHLGHDQEGGLIWVNSHDGQPRASLWGAKGTTNGMLNLQNAAGKNNVVLSTDEHGGYLDLYGTNGKSQAMVDCNSKTGGALRLLQPNGQRLIFAGPHSKNGNGHFVLSGTDGTSGIDVFVNANEEGMVWGIDKANTVARWLK